MNAIICKTFEETLKRGKRESAKHYYHSPFYIVSMETLKGNKWFIAHLTLHEDISPKAVLGKAREGATIVTWNAEKRRWNTSTITREDIEDVAAEMAAWSN